MSKRRGYRNRNIKRVVNRLHRLRRFPKKRRRKYKLLTTGRPTYAPKGKVGALALPPVDWAEKHRYGWL